MKHKSSIASGRPLQGAGHPWQPADRVATVGWISMAIVVAVAVVAAACGTF